MFEEPSKCMDTVQAAWPIPPEWVVALATEADHTSQNKAARKVGYSAATVSLVLKNRYAGDLRKVEDKVRGALMGDCVDCPILGMIGINICRDNQALPFAVTSSLATRLYRACRSGCTHSSLETETC